MSKRKRLLTLASGVIALGCALGSVHAARAAVAPTNERLSLERVSVTVDGAEVTSPKAQATLAAQNGGLVFSLAQAGADLEVYDVAR